MNSKHLFGLFLGTTCFISSFFCNTSSIVAFAGIISMLALFIMGFPFLLIISNFIYKKTLNTKIGSHMGSASKFIFKLLFAVPSMSTK